MYQMYQRMVRNSNLEMSKYGLEVIKSVIKVSIRRRPVLINMETNRISIILNKLLSKIIQENSFLIRTWCHIKRRLILIKVSFKRGLYQIQTMLLNSIKKGLWVITICLLSLNFKKSLLKIWIYRLSKCKTDLYMGIHRDTNFRIDLILKNNHLKWIKINFNLRVSKILTIMLSNKILKKTKKSNNQLIFRYCSKKSKRKRRKRRKKKKTRFEKSKKNWKRI